MAREIYSLGFHERPPREEFVYDSGQGQNRMRGVVAFIPPYRWLPRDWRGELTGAPEQIFPGRLTMIDASHMSIEDSKRFVSWLAEMHLRYG